MTQPALTTANPGESAVAPLRPPPGSAPGTLVSQPDASHPVMTLYTYGPDDLVQRTVGDVGELRAELGRLPVTWVDVVGVGDTRVVSQLGELFDVHNLAVADVVHSYQRPKVDEYDDHLFIVLRMSADPLLNTSEQLSIFLGENYVLTFQDRAGTDFDPVRQRLRKSHGRLRSGGADYLAYALIDSVVDSYFPILEQFGEAMERLEERLMANPEPELVPEIHELKRRLLKVRRIIWAQREMINTLIRSDSSLIGAQTTTYLRDCYDHAVELLDIVEVYREISSGFIDVFLSIVGIKTNEVMKVLTIIATIFIPLSFIAGVYGMNFDTNSPWNMPELKWSLGYPFALVLMAAVAAALLQNFRSKGWLGARRRPDNSKATDDDDRDAR